jgi:hypothetical protein
MKVLSKLQLGACPEIDLHLLGEYLPFNLSNKDSSNVKNLLEEFHCIEKNLVV